MSKQIQKKGPSKKPEKKDTEKLNEYVECIRNDNSIKLYSKDKKPQIVKLAYVLVPKQIKVKQEDGKFVKKHETYDYECHEFLRRKLVCGKKIRFEVVKKNEYTKFVVPYINKENIILSLLEKGLAYINEDGKKIPEYKEKFQKALDAKLCIHDPNASTKASKEPKELYYNEKEIKDFVNKKAIIKGHILKAVAPGVYIIETEERKRIEASLYGINQYLQYDRRAERFILDEDGFAAMEHIKKHYIQRDCTVQIVSADKYNISFVKIGEKDIGEELLKNGFVICRKTIDYSEEIRQKYQNAEKEAKKNKAARWTDFDQEEEDRIIAERLKRQKEIEDRVKNAPVIKGEVVHIGRIIKIKSGDKEFRINLASVAPIHMKDEKESELLMFRIKEVLRNALVGKKNVEYKEAYQFVSENKNKEKITDTYYDVYVAKKNIAFTLIQNGLVNVIKNSNVFKRSFDYEEMLNIEKKEYKSKEVQFLNDSKLKKLEGNEYQCVVERVYSPIRYLVYIPSEDCRLVVNLDHCRLQKEVEESVKDSYNKFIDEATKNVKSMFGINTVGIEITRVEKVERKGEKKEASYYAYCEISTKKNNELSRYVLEKAYALPFGEIKMDLSEVKENEEGIYKFRPKRRDQKEERKPKEKPKREEKPKELVFSEGKKVCIVGFDGLNIYYYEKKEDAQYLEELGKQLRALPKGPIDMKEKNKCIVEIKGKQYRGEILSVSQGANVVQCIDTGVTCVCGKNKLKPITEELAKKEFARPKSIALCGIKQLSRDNQSYKVSLEEISQFYDKEAVIYENKIADDKVSAKVIVGDICINTFLVRQGLASLDKYFNDHSEWGKSMFQAQEEAREQHLNIYKYGEFEEEEEKKEEKKEKKDQNKKKEVEEKKH